MRIQIITDAWHPQVNGVVRTLTHTVGELEKMGHRINLVTPLSFRTLPCPGYPEIRLAMVRPGHIGDRLEQFQPEAVHIATEGPLGIAARHHCLRAGIPFTTSFHTRFPEYLRMRTAIPAEWGYAALRRFHGSARRTLVPTDGLRQELSDLGFRNLALWGHGVDTKLFRPRLRRTVNDSQPIWLYAGRVATEKNIEAFLSLDLPGTKWVVGGGPALSSLRRRFPEVKFFGVKTGEELAQFYSDADAFVFPSLTDTFGNVILEALASGLPVAAFPVRGPKDILEGSGVGCLDADLRRAAMAALEIPRASCRAFAERFTLQSSADQFVSNLWSFDRWRSLVNISAA